MKNLIFTLVILLAGITGIPAQEKCDTLKIKVIKTYYCEFILEGFYKIGDLEGAVINIDTLPVFYPGIEVVNVSNDTFSTGYTIGATIRAYPDTGIISTPWNYVYYNSFPQKLVPNDTITLGAEIKCDIVPLINSLKDINVDFEKITHWEMIITITYTDKDGLYTDSVVYAGADTSIFYIVKTPLSIQETDNKQSTISVFPNPAQSQFTVTGAGNASIRLYNMQGQQVMQTTGKGENIVISTEHLPAGTYILKVEKDNAIYTRKVQVVR